MYRETAFFNAIIHDTGTDSETFHAHSTDQNANDVQGVGKRNPHMKKSRSWVW